MNITSVTQSEMGWHVPSSSTGEIYLIQEQKINCNCKLSCSLCEACLHAYSCSCLDNSFRWNMYKHIHLVWQYKKSVGENCMNLTRNEDEENDLVIDETNNESYNEQQELIHVISKKKDKHEDLQAEKEKLKRNLAFKKILRSLEPIMAALRQNNENAVPTTRNIIPHNKNINKQRRLFSTKKKNKKFNSVCFE
nr:unnamed protein product [Callosobruchus analis]